MYKQKQNIWMQKKKRISIIRRASNMIKTNTNSQIYMLASLLVTLLVC